MGAWDTLGARFVGRAAGSLVLVTASVLLPAGAAAAAPQAQADPVVSVTQVSVTQQQERRLANGQFVRSGNRNGAGKLTIKNGASHDAVATMTINRNAVYSVYVRKGMEFTVTGIRDGTYEMFFTSGTDWDSQARGFTRERSLSRLDRTMQYRTTSSGWIEGSVTLYRVPGGNTDVNAVDPNNYPAP